MDSAIKSNPVLVSEPNLPGIQDAVVNSGAVNLPCVHSVPQKELEIYFQIED